MSNIDKQALRNLAVAAKLTPSWYAVGEFGDVVDPAKPEWKPVHEFCKTFTAARVLALLDELEAAEKRIAELSASHGNLREAMAGIHNTITAGGAYTPLAAILNSSKRAYEESAAAAGKGE
ncbi:ead/Ea22-like family protein [Enterobacter hormaechei]|uniref:ead/Ea22-like family protein n=1 Tax=Enterobacter hormaechei TaxID=158836 RepID=UPI0021B4F900|nr:ead/Ea22-like family protein [Enterobacter hormaechei]MCW8152730.1 ead/Ea22-like family protein [Enterobacter hormaechei]